MKALKLENLDPLFVSWKNRTVDFMKAYQEQDVAKMLSNCSKDCSVQFLPLGENGKGNIHEVGKTIWSSIIESFPNIDNTVNTVVEENGNVRCEASIRGKQVKDFAGLTSMGYTFEEDHIFIFKMDEIGVIENVSVNWDHESLVHQLTEGQTSESSSKPTRMNTDKRRELLRKIASDYVIKGLGGKNFDAIAYDETIELRAPINPNGSQEPMSGKSIIKENWWAPLPTLVSGTELLDIFMNDDLTTVTVEFHCHIANPKCTLRIVDRFVVNDFGKIIKQENFFDPRDITNAGWRNSS